jgi:hypothetical protein
MSACLIKTGIRQSGLYVREVQGKADIAIPKACSSEAETATREENASDQEQPRFDSIETERALRMQAQRARTMNEISIQAGV